MKMLNGVYYRDIHSILDNLDIYGTWFNDVKLAIYYSVHDITLDALHLQINLTRKEVENEFEHI